MSKLKSEDGWLVDPEKDRHAINLIRYLRGGFEDGEFKEVWGRSPLEEFLNLAEHERDDYRSAVEQLFEDFKKEL